MANTIDWGKATQNNTNGFGKYQNTIGAASVYADSYAGETAIVGTSAAFSYSKSSYHQDEADPTPTITGTTGGSFNASAGLVFVDTGTHNSTTGQIDLSASTIDSHIITYTVDGVQSGQTVGVTASPFITNNFSMNFDSASSQYVDAGNPTELQITGDLTISMWFKTTNTSGYLISDTAAIAGCYSILMGGGGGQLWARRGNGTNSETTQKTSNTYNDGNWHNITFVSDSTMRIYIDGVLDVQSTVNTPSNIGGTTNVKIGSGFSSFDGDMDEVAIWNKALELADVQTIYNATNDNPGKCANLWSGGLGTGLVYWNRMGD